MPDVPDQPNQPQPDMQDEEMRTILEAIARDEDAAPSNRVAAIRELRVLRRRKPGETEDEDFEGNLGRVQTK